ncbi:MAG: cysteine desulfurase family protein [Planctomycetota bacterium]|jgi:cysteine desulfurase
MDGAPIYLDNAATTRPLGEVVSAMSQAQLDSFGNPSSPHRFGKEPRKLLDDAREFMRGSLSAAQAILTSGGTEADLLGILGAASAREPGKVIAAASDHPAILAQSEALARLGHRMLTLPVSEHGDLQVETLARHVDKDLRVLALMHGHNELGTLPALSDLVQLVRAKAPGAHVHVDLVQSYGKIPFDLDAQDVDSVAISAHKFHGPRGMGCLALSSKAKISPLQLGGGQEHGMRGGTENVASAVGMAVAAEAVTSSIAESAKHTDHLCEIFLAKLQEKLPKVLRLGHPERRLPHLLSLRIPGVVAETCQQRMDARGVAFSTGSACHGGDAENHVLAAIGFEAPEAREVMRISFSKLNTEAEARTAADLMVEEAGALLKLSAGLD